MSWPVCGSALPATSGTPRPVSFFPRTALKPRCHDGTGANLLTPPPLAPSASFQTTSLTICLPSVLMLVPPQVMKCGDDDGNSTLRRCVKSRSCTPWSETPLSPDEHRIVTPSAAAATP